MTQIVHRLCAEVVVDRNGQRLFPLGKKKIPQKEVRLVEINRSPPGKPTWRTGRLEIGPIGQNSETAEWSTGLETLNKIDKQYISKGSLILTLKKTNNVPSLSFQSMDEITMIILRQADSQNLTTLMNMIDSLMTTGSVKRKEAVPLKPITLPAQPIRTTNDFPLSGISAAAKPHQKSEAGSKWELPKHLAEMGNMPNNSTVVNKISLREHRLMKLGLSESDEEREFAQRNRQQLKELPVHKQSPEIKPERARFEMLYSQLFLHKVLAYLTPKESTLLGLINKKCHALYCSMRRELNYSRFTEIPENHLLSLIKKCHKVERIVWGKLQGFKSVADKFSNFQLNNLVSMDCSVMSDFKDTTVVMFTRFAPNLKELSLPYYSLTSHSMLLMVKEFPRLEVFRALHFGNHRSSGVLNEKLSAKSVSEFLFNKPYLRDLEMFCLESSSLKSEIGSETASTIRTEAKGDSGLSSIRSESCPAATVKGLVRSLTVHNLLARSIGNLSQLEQLGSQFPSLQTLVIGSIYMTPYQQIPSPPSSTFKNVLAKLPPTLNGLGLGEFVDDEILTSVPRTVKELSINSPHVTDEGLSTLLRQIHPRRLDLRGSMLISWEAFQHLEPIVVPPITTASSSHLFGGALSTTSEPTNKPGLREVILRGEKSRAEEIQQYLREKGFRGCRVVNYEPTRG